MFSVFRLPLFLAALALVVWIEKAILAAERTSSMNIDKREAWAATVSLVIALMEAAWRCRLLERWDDRVNGQPHCSFLTAATL